MKQYNLNPGLDPESMAKTELFNEIINAPLLDPHKDLARHRNIWLQQEFGLPIRPNQDKNELSDRIREAFARQRIAELKERALHDSIKEAGSWEGDKDGYEFEEI